MYENILKEIDQGQEDWAFNIGVQAYIWGYPMIECWKDRLKKIQPVSDEKNIDLLHKPEYHINVFKHIRAFVTPESREFVNAARDFLYSTAVLDLYDEPVVLTAPDFDSRWYVLQILDPYMETLENLGTRTCGEQLPPVILVGTQWQGTVPDGMKLIRCEHNFIYIVARVMASPDENLDNVHTLQNDLKIIPLSYWNEPTLRTNLSKQQSKNKSYAPLSSDLSECPEGLKFFEELAAVIQYTPPRADEGMLLDLFSEVAISIENGFEHENLPEGVKNGLEKAIPFAQTILDRKLYEIGKNINGWGLLLDIGNYDKKYIARALVAKHGIWANIPQESIYFMARTDSKGELLHGRNCYEINFSKGMLPPVNAFWSVSYYDKNGSLIDTPMGNASVNSVYSDIHYNENHSLTIYIGQKDPGIKRKANWLYSHDGIFHLNLRCYNPKQKLLDLEYQVPAIVKV